MGEFTCRLWAQKVFISVLGAKELLKQPFRANSEEYEAHATHKLELGDTTMDGKSIQLVVEPAIVAWGNERGESYHLRKVWSKAVVWLSSSPAEQPNIAIGEARVTG